jgi:hypothetical protein
MRVVAIKGGCARVSHSAPRVWQLRNAVTSYDGWYVAVAEALIFRWQRSTFDSREREDPACEFLIP